jgi:hypothetical protein
VAVPHGHKRHHRGRVRWYSGGQLPIVTVKRDGEKGSGLEEVGKLYVDDR